MESLEASLRPLAGLSEDVRRRCYVVVRSLGRPATREEVAREVGISRKLAAFHLDKLADLGLLVTSYGHPGRAGRGAGRTSKLYEPSAMALEVSIPARRYELAGRIALEAMLSRAERETPLEALCRTAMASGRRIGTEARRGRRGGRLGKERAMAWARDALAASGFEPHDDAADGIRLRNCPFDALARDFRDAVCPMNRSFVEGLVGGLGSDRVAVELAPEPGWCCVRLRAR